MWTANLNPPGRRLNNPSCRNLKPLPKKRLPYIDISAAVRKKLRKMGWVNTLPSPHNEAHQPTFPTQSFQPALVSHLIGADNQDLQAAED